MQTFFSLKSLCLDYLALNNLLAFNQFGFRRGRSSFNSVYGRVTKDKGSVNDVVFNDLRKAFDTVDHVIMLRKLKTIEVTSTDLACGSPGSLSNLISM